MCNTNIKQKYTEHHFNKQNINLQRKKRMFKAKDELEQRTRNIEHYTFGD